MTFHDISVVFDEIAQTSSRLEITRLLAGLFKKASPTEARIICYLSLGLLRPPYETTQFGIASKTMTKIVAELLDTSAEDIKEQLRDIGDLGLIAGNAEWHKTGHKNLTVEEVYEQLSKLEATSGTGSQEEKSNLLLKLLKAVDPRSAQVIIRVVLGTLRLGFSDMTLIDALSWALAGDKSLRATIEHAYNICADIGRIAYVALSDGIDALENLNIVVGIPIRPAAAERLPTPEDIIEKIGPCVAQPKLDGFRLQIHFKYDARTKKHQLWFFSRNLLDMSHMFPDLVQAFENYPFGEIPHSLIVEGEAIVFDAKKNKFLPFQETVKRKRKHDIEETMSNLPLYFFLFDLLYYNNTSYLDKPHKVRRQKLEQLFHTKDKHIAIIPERFMETAQDLEDYFLEEIGEGLEGLVVKRPDASYQPGKRNFNWIKLKKHEKSEIEDTIDTVILGYYYGRGKRSKFGIGAFLVGVYDKKHDQFETIAKVGTGLSDEAWIELKKKCDAKAIPEKPNNVECSKELYPNVWVAPEIVCEVRADEITRSPLHTAGKTTHAQGLALRFPRFIQYRADKSAQEVTTVEEIKKMEQHQRREEKA